MHDLGRAYHLRKWVIENSPNEKNCYNEEVEYLRNELNYWSALHIMKWLGIFGFVYFTWEFFFVEH